jgi:hypothetical protein
VDTPKVSQPLWYRPLTLLFGGLMTWGGVMHFTVDQRIWHSELLDVMAASGFMWREVGIVNIVAGAALIANRFTALALAALLPITLNIFLLHASRHDLWGLTIGVPVLAMNTLLLWTKRESYRALLLRG